MNKKTLTWLVAGAVFALLSLVAAVFFFNGGRNRSDEETIDRAKESVKLILHFHGDAVHSQGTGFVVNEYGDLVTNAHVVGIQEDESKEWTVSKDSSFYVVYIKPFKQQKMVILQRATLRTKDFSRDLAWLHIAPDHTDLRPLALGNTTSSGRNIVALGFSSAYDPNLKKLKSLFAGVARKIREYGIDPAQLPERFELEWTVELDNLLNVATQGGTVSQVDSSGEMLTGLGRDATTMIVKHNAQVKPGMSGGPIVDRETGRVLGVTYATSADDHDINSAIDVSVLKHFLESMGGNKNYIESDPDAPLRRIRAYLSEAETYEIALLSVLGLFALCVLLGTVIILTQGGKRKHKVKAAGVQVRPASAAAKVEDAGPTLPYSTASLVLSGQDPDGAPLRFKLQQSELRRKRRYLLGKSETCDIRLPYTYVSRQHAYLIYEDDVIYIEDAKATNPTKVNDEEITGRCPLYADDEISIGSIVLKVSVENR